MDWLAGHKLQGDKYVIEGILSKKGGSSIIYLAKDTSNNKKVVIKTLKYEILNDPELPDSQKEKYNEYLREEARLLKLFNHPNSHPNIVKFETSFDEDLQTCIVMEYIEGETLWDLVNNQGALTEEDALLYIRQIGYALLFIHEHKAVKNCVHRDVNPSNIIVRKNLREAVLIDFNIAREYSSSRPLTKMINKGYSPIEQYGKNKKQGKYTDVYGLAATLYYLVVGEEPEESIFRSSADVLEPKSLNPRISDSVNQAIKKGMKIQPVARSQSVQEWLKLLPIQHPPLDQFSFEVVTLDCRGQEMKDKCCQKQAKFFTQDFGNGVGLEMVDIPSGEFLMGSLAEENGRVICENPQHKVSVDSFYLGKYPVTQAQWDFVVTLPKVNIDLIPHCSHFKGENRPVENVSWDGAIEFCARLSYITNLNYRLPSEAEWEYACRAGTITPFHLGDTITTEFANYDGREKYSFELTGRYLGETTPVGSSEANAFGLYDMHGNVWEWCADPKHNNYEGAPQDGRVWEIEDVPKPARVLRGGSWQAKAKECRSASRRFILPSARDATYGFRVALSI
jgi:formylglycine-generating enzyme required for sulfatase activity/tRNA A-37 threonylcarbamoyl transferase component Bud32